MKDKIINELNHIFDSYCEEVVGFISITLSKSEALGRVIPTITDITKNINIKPDDVRKIHEKMVDLGELLSGIINKT